jgi:hypothetical protein
VNALFLFQIALHFFSHHYPKPNAADGFFQTIHKHFHDRIRPQITMPIFARQPDPQAEWFRSSNWSAVFFAKTINGAEWDDILILFFSLSSLASRPSTCNILDSHCESSSLQSWSCIARRHILADGLVNIRVHVKPSPKARSIRLVLQILVA